jgi:hypothetical protein
MARRAAHPHAGTRTRRCAPARRRATALLALAGLGAACATRAPIAPASLEGSRRLVRVEWAVPQTLVARSAARDSTLAGVTRAVGWPTTVRGDTVHLQVAEWRADGRGHRFRAPDYTIAVVADAGATIRPHGGGSTGAVVVGLLVLVAAAFAIAASGWLDSGFS